MALGLLLGLWWRGDNGVFNQCGRLLGSAAEVSESAARAATATMDSGVNVTTSLVTFALASAAGGLDATEEAWRQLWCWPPPLAPPPWALLPTQPPQRTTPPRGPASPTQPCETSEAASCRRIEIQHCSGSWVVYCRPGPSSGGSDAASTAGGSMNTDGSAGQTASAGGSMNDDGSAGQTASAGGTTGNKP